MSKDNLTNEIRRKAKSVPVTDREVALNVQRIIRGTDRPSERVLNELRSADSIGVDANGAQHLNLTRDQLDLLTRADASPMTHGAGGDQVPAPGQNKIGSRHLGSGRDGVYAQYTNVLDVGGTPSFVTYAPPAAQLSLAEITDGDLGSVGITRQDFTPQRVFTGTSFSSQIIHASATSTADMMSALRSSLNVGIDQLVFDTAVADLLASKVNLGLAEAAWLTGLLEGVYTKGFKDPMIIGSTATIAKFAGSTSFERPAYGQIAGIPMITTAASVASADQLIVVEAGDSGLSFADFDVAVILDKYTQAPAGITTMTLGAMFDVAVTDSTKVVRFDLAA